MHSFKAGSHTWEIAIHVAAIKRVRERLGTAPNSCSTTT